MTNTRTTFADFIASRQRVDSLDEHGCAPDLEEPGYVYLDSFYLYELTTESIDREGNDQFDREIICQIGSCEYNFGDNLDAAERFLWDEFAFLELNGHIFEACRFGWTDEDSYDGFTDGSTWNGFNNVCVTERVHNKILEDNTIARSPAERKEVDELMAQPQSEERDEAIYCIDPFLLIDPDEFRMYDYSNGFATMIDEDHYHTVNR